MARQAWPAGETLKSRASASVAPRQELPGVTLRLSHRVSGWTPGRPFCVAGMPLSRRTAAHRQTQEWHRLAPSWLQPQGLLQAGLRHVGQLHRLTELLQITSPAFDVIPARHNASLNPLAAKASVPLISLTSLIAPAKHLSRTR